MGMPEGEGRKSAPQRRKRKPTERTSISVVSGIAPCVTVDDSSQQAKLSNSHLAQPPWFTTPHRWHRVRLRPLTNHLHCALFLEILGCATGAGKNIPSHASPRRSLCAAQGMEGVFQPRCSFTPNQVFQCLLSLQRPLYSVSLPLLHTGFTRLAIQLLPIPSFFV